MANSTPIHITYKWNANDMVAELEAMTLDELGTRKIRNAIRAELKTARKNVIQEARNALPNDPRQSSTAVKKIVYKKGLGGNISLFDKARSKVMSISKVHKGGKSGIRRYRKISYRTKQINGYVGTSRAFILRWVEGGTNRRFSKSVKYAYRGSIHPRPFFKAASEKALSAASEHLNVRLEKMIRRNIKARAKQQGNLK